MTGLDVTKLYAALDGVRQKRDLSWRAVAKEVHVAASTLSRMHTGAKRPDADSLVRMLVWAELDLRKFYAA